MDAFKRIDTRSQVAHKVLPALEADFMIVLLERMAG